MGFSALAPGLYTFIKSLKMCIKSDLEEIILKLSAYGQRKGLSVVIKILSPRGCLPYPGVIYMYKSIKIDTRTKYQVSAYRTTGPLV